jgi:hypothetical protein
LTPAEQANARLTVAPSNGNVAYISEIPSKGAPLLWRTTDAGQRWTPLPSPPDHRYTSGNLMIDQNDPLTVIASFTSGDATSASALYDTYASIDGSQQWRPVYGRPVASDSSGSLSSWKGVYYVTLLTTSPNGFFRSDLLASTDQMGSWHAIDAQIIAKDTLAPTGEVGVANFWVNPTTGALLAQTYNSTRTGELWMSEDHGASWSKVMLPPSPVSEVGETSNWVTGALLWVAQPIVGPDFHLCAWFTEGPNSANFRFYCSSDSGRTWTRRPSLQVGALFPTLMLADGALLSQNSSGFYLEPGADTQLTTTRHLGSVPGSGSIVGVSPSLGATARGVTFWQTTDANRLYVAQYSLANV